MILTNRLDLNSYDQSEREPERNKNENGSPRTL